MARVWLGWAGSQSECLFGDLVARNLNRNPFLTFASGLVCKLPLTTARQLASFALAEIQSQLEASLPSASTRDDSWAPTNRNPKGLHLRKLYLQTSAEIASREIRIQPRIQDYWID